MLTIKAIIPKHLFDPPKMQAGIADALDRQALAIQTDYEATVSTWSHRVTFPISKIQDGYQIGTNDPIYGYVEFGTKAHTIRARGRFLRFASGYRAKTAPGVIGSQSGGASGNPAFAKVVRHPGTKARKFSQAIAKKNQPLFKTAIQTAIREALS